MRKYDSGDDHREQHLLSLTQAARAKNDVWRTPAGSLRPHPPGRRNNHPRLRQYHVGPVPTSHESRDIGIRSPEQV